jgi:glycosyltransferase involved in cell wall biosynthesis
MTPVTKHNMGKLYYVYPRFQNMSFTRIAEAHIAGIQDKINVVKVHEDYLDNLLWLDPRNILLHPILYVTMGHTKDMTKSRYRRLAAILKVRRHLGGFETADSDMISQEAVKILDNFEVIFLPSTWAVNCFKKSGVQTPCELLPHGLSNEMISDTKTISDPDIKGLLDDKTKKKAIFVLFFCLHSEYRKGADIVADAMRFLQQKHNNLWIVIKSPRINNVLQGLRMHHVGRWLNEDQLRQLYDICDILIVPSRGGGFELNALEGIARGLPTLAPNGGCFSDYSDCIVPLKITSTPKVFPDNPIHVGNGWETSSDELAYTLEKVIDNLEWWKEKAKESSIKVKERYSWKSICDNLYSLLGKYGFTDKT